MNVRDRLKKARGLVSKLGLSALLISRPSNITYFTGFIGGSRLLVPGEGEPTIFVGGVDLTAAEEHFSGTGVAVRHIKLGEKLDDVVLGALRELGPGVLGFDELPLKSYLRFSRELGQGRLRDVGDEVWALRKAKDGRELEAIRKACEIASRALEIVPEILRPGLSELELAGGLERELRRAGSEAHPFQVIVASGPNSALPHARPSDRRLEEGDLVVIDLGATYHGYVSDMTRTFVVGSASKEQEKAYELVLRAQREGIMALRAGVRACDVDRAA
ncbi:hypothetical protein DRO33_02830, partial [Candidatus Bathyarchaeota archaeon]